MTSPIHAQLHTFIEGVYAELEKSPNFTARPEQHTLSRNVAECFVDNIPLAAEAPTGTGKTLAYMIGAVAASRQLGSGPASPMPVVISTGTKALQSQLVSKDLPILIKAGVLKREDVVLAKGKGNYFCAKSAMGITGLDDNDENEDKADDAGMAMISMAAVEPMLDAFEDGTWDGDFDNFVGAKPKSVERIRVNSETCNGPKCSEYSRCAYFKMKNKLPSAKVIVANHDLVLIDLMRVSMEQEPAFPIADYLLVMDEGHHIPQKALEAGSTVANFTTLAIDLQRVKFFRQEAFKTPALIRHLNARGMTASQLDGAASVRACVDMAEILREQVGESNDQRRYSKGVVPVAFAGQVKECRTVLSALNDRIVEIINALQALAQSEGADGEREAAEAVRSGMNLHRTIFEAISACDAFNGQGKVVKWVLGTEKLASLHTSPLEGADVLIPLLWNSTRARPVFTSATLRDLDGFERFKAKSGYPDKTRTLVLPYTFPYAKSTLTVPFMAATPKPSERKAFLAELAVKVPACIDKGEGTLILFPSWTLLKEMTPLLKTKFGQEMVLVQGERTVKSLLEVHCRRIDNARGSILCGVQTMAEGLDLPGNYCKHVIILALPFSVPSDPVEQEVAEMLGNAYFMKRSLPDAVTRLVQMVGRLLRRESDTGRVTIFDRRLTTSSYGSKMIKGLPPFRLVVEQELQAA